MVEDGPRNKLSRLIISERAHVKLNNYEDIDEYPVSRVIINAIAELNIFYEVIGDNDTACNINLL